MDIEEITNEIEWYLASRRLLYGIVDGPKSAYLILGHLEDVVSEMDSRIEDLQRLRGEVRKEQVTYAKEVAMDLRNG